MIHLVVVALWAAAQTAAADPSENKTVVVTGRTLQSTQRDLDSCLARQCPPAEDIDVSLAHAENQFIAGDYAGARLTLRKSYERNNRFGRELPVQVADLTRAYGRLSDLDGYMKTGRILQIDALDTLKKGLEQGDSRILMQRLMTGDDYARRGRLTAAEDVYQTVEKQAKAANKPGVQGYAMLRQAVIFGAAASIRPEYKYIARKKLDRLLLSNDPKLAPFKDVAGLLRTRLAVLDGDANAIDEAAAELAAKRFTRPVLIYSPDVPFNQAPRSDSQTVTEHSSSDPEWIDVGFRIAPDGTVHDVEVLRRSEAVYGPWPQTVRKMLVGRRYAPMALSEDAPVLQRVERFTLVHPITTSSRSRIRYHSAMGQIASLDLTKDMPSATTGTP